MSEEKPKALNPIQIIQERRREERERAEEQFKERAEERFKERAREAYVSAGGDGANFEKSFPLIRERIIADATVDAMKGKGR
jgi:vacuolar-type H+-ATPase subunit E/Vma4